MTKTTKRRSRAKLMPEVELPPKISELVCEYIGPRRMARLTSLQRARLSRISQDVGHSVGQVLDPEHEPNV